jgi:nucleoside-diphosphate-sugar epimerase
VDGIVLAAASAGAAGQIFNLTDGHGVRCISFFQHHWRWLGRGGRPLCLPTPVAMPLARSIHQICRLFRLPTEISAASVLMLARSGTYSIDKARTILGYSPQVALAEGMDRTRTWLAAQRLIP